MDAPDPMDRRCTARSKRSGQRCKRRPIPGGSVCVMHGGKAPQVKLAAKDRLAALVDPAIDALQRALDHRDINAAIRAAKDLLDRAGFAAPKQMQVGVDAEPPSNHEEHRAREAGGMRSPARRSVFGQARALATDGCSRAGVC